MRKFIIIITAALAVGAVIVSLQIQRRTQTKFRAIDAILREQHNHIAHLAAENQRLSHRVAKPKPNHTMDIDRTAELEQLRAKIETLRQQTNRLAELTERRKQQRLSAGTQFFSEGDSNLLKHSRETTITFDGGPRAAGKLNDARALTAALRKYADEHEGAFPFNLEQIGPYLPKPSEADSPPWANAPLSGTNDFHLVFQGSQTDLTNIPPRRVALIRERQPWLTPDGKWARVYGYADGAASPVESDDNFQSWDAQHIIPPSVANR